MPPKLYPHTTAPAHDRGRTYLCHCPLNIPKPLDPLLLLLLPRALQNDMDVSCIAEALEAGA